MRILLILIVALLAVIAFQNPDTVRGAVQKFIERREKPACPDTYVCVPK